MNLTPENVQFGAAKDIQIRPFAMVKAGATATVLPVTTVEGFVVGQSCIIERTTGVALAAVVIDAINALTKTITFAGVGFSVAPGEGDTLVGPVLLELGGTSDGVSVAITPELVTVDYDQVPMDVEQRPVHYSGDVRFTLREFNLKQYGLLAQMGYVARAAGAGITEANVIDLAVGRKNKYGVRFIIEDDDNPALNTYLTFWRVGSLEGLTYTHAKRESTNLPVGFHALADGGRPKAQMMGQIIQEIGPASS